MNKPLVMHQSKANWSTRILQYEPTMEMFSSIGKQNQNVQSNMYQSHDEVGKAELPHS
jgi:hypothetical protein